LKKKNLVSFIVVFIVVFVVNCCCCCCFSHITFNFTQPTNKQNKL
jgi:hypothetical protein